MKPVLYWTLHRTCSGRHRLIAVVTVKRSRSGFIVYGRDRNAVDTHFVGAEARGRFASREAAQALLDSLDRIEAKHALSVKMASDALANARSALGKSIRRELERAGAGILDARAA